MHTPRPIMISDTMKKAHEAYIKMSKMQLEMEMKVLRAYARKLDEEITNEDC